MIVNLFGTNAMDRVLEMLNNQASQSNQVGLTWVVPRIHHLIVKECQE